MACVPPPDRDRAVREVAQAYERIKLQQPLLLHCSSSHSQPPSATTPATQLLAHSLLGEALRALNVALSVMNHHQQQGQPTPLSHEPPQLSPATMSPGCNADSKAIATTARGGKRRRASSAMEGVGIRSPSSWVSLTTVPYEDGYEWRKYGEKKINGADYTRSYFRCTYRDDTGCPATKQVQQQGFTAAACSDAPMFQVTYINKHTCNTCSRMMPSTSSPAAASMNTVKQETQTPVLPPHPVILVDASALPSEQVPFLCQDPLFPTSTQQFCGNGNAAAAPSSTATSSPCIPCESCNEEYSMAAAEEASAGVIDDPFVDIDIDLDHLLFLYDSFKDY